MRWAAAFSRRSDIAAEFARIWDEGTVRLQGATITLSVLEDNEVVYIGARNSENTPWFDFRVGMRLPMAFTATGHAFMSRMADAEIRYRFRNGLPGTLTRHSPKTIDAVLDLVARTRTRGYALDAEYVSEGMVCFGALVLGADNRRWRASRSACPPRSATPKRTGGWCRRCCACLAPFPGAWARRSRNTRVDVERRRRSRHLLALNSGARWRDMPERYGHWLERRYALIRVSDGGGAPSRNRRFGLPVSVSRSSPWVGWSKCSSDGNPNRNITSAAIRVSPSEKRTLAERRGSATKPNRHRASRRMPVAHRSGQSVAVGRDHRRVGDRAERPPSTTLRTRGPGTLRNPLI